MREQCKDCHKVQWLSEDSYEDHMVNRLKLEAGVPRKAALVLLIIERDLNFHCKTYKWTEDDTVELSKKLYELRAKSQKLCDLELPFSSSMEILENAFSEVVIPKYDREDYVNVKIVVEKMQPSYEAYTKKS